MTRKKVNMAFIENETARKSTFKKRKRGVLKKAHELATLCDIPICVIVNSAYESNPEMWPSREAADKVVSQWRMMSVMDQTKRMVNQESFLQQRITKATESWRKARRENKELEMKNIMFDCLSGKTLVSRLPKCDLRDFGSVIEQHLKDVNRRMEILKRNDDESSSSLVPIDAATTSSAMPMIEMGSSSSSGMPMIEMGSSSVEFHEKIRDQSQNTLNMKNTNKDLDMNKKQW
ncbi:PREDICTED: agamous-like MADS-box protein AGL80 [Camelina sativa]|uniref:Agamous-like MADS-box protein AGL80 n=1 Tax=Camelina sativa TaxID=90675 RepID=A0ABM0VEM4_CAMSA|nr:PREDICTED: agamous-like MADS-box protein AGL80 [Camelina sativa]XP_010455019.1 PREDICTED: agamous-like MADS-box protein AGL80 [Camelina sativa]